MSLFRTRTSRAERGNGAVTTPDTGRFISSAIWSVPYRHTSDANSRRGHVLLGYPLGLSQHRLGLRAEVRDGVGVLERGATRGERPGLLFTERLQERGVGRREQCEKPIGPGSGEHGVGLPEE